MKTIRDIRKGCGISQVSLAEILSGIRGGGAFQGPISNIERGEVSPTVRRLSDILEALGYELHIEARKGRERVPLDLASLMGKCSRAKDAPVKDSQEGPPSPDSEAPQVHPPELPPVQKPPPNPEPDTLQDTLLRALARI